MKVILTTNIRNLGKVGDTVSVKNGYARNFLFPNQMALRENKKNIEHYKNIKNDIDEKEKSKFNEAKNLLDEISKINIVFSKEADEKGQLYGSITKKEIIDFFTKNNLKVKSDDIFIKEQIKSIGEHEFEIKPYIDLNKIYKLTVNKN